MGGARRAEEEATERAAELLRNCVLPHATHQRPEPHAYLPACLWTSYILLLGRWLGSSRCW